MDAEQLLRYARHVKNSRLVLLARDEPEPELLKFLRSKHRYREMAVVEEKSWTGRGFKLFEPPILINFPIEDELLKKALNASLFLLSPLLLLQEEKELEALLAWRRKGKFGDFPNLLRHIRIAEYAMIDAVERKVDRDFARKDGEKRFWRIKEEGDRPAVDYLVFEGKLCVVLYGLL